MIGFRTLLCQPKRITDAAIQFGSVWFDLVVRRVWALPFPHSCLIFVPNFDGFVWIYFENANIDFHFTHRQTMSVARLNLIRCHAGHRIHRTPQRLYNVLPNYMVLTMTVHVSIAPFFGIRTIGFVCWRFVEPRQSKFQTADCKPVEMGCNASRATQSSWKSKDHTETVAFSYDCVCDLTQQANEAKNRRKKCTRHRAPIYWANTFSWCHKWYTFSVVYCLISCQFIDIILSGWFFLCLEKKAAK